MHYNCNMNFPKHFRLPKTPLIIGVILVLLLIAVAMILFYKKTAPNNSRSTSEHSTSQQHVDNPDSFTVKPTNNDPGAVQTGIDTQTSDESAGAAAFPTTQPNLSVAIRSVKQAGQTLTVDTAINPNADGMCTIELTREGHATITKSANFSGSSCMDKSLSLQNASSGSWNLTVKVVVGSNVATATQAVTIR
jgi:hypothetical protein